METPSQKYKTNLFTLRFKDEKIRKAFSKSFFYEDLYALRFVIMLGVVLSLAFLFVDYFKYTDPWISIAFRGAMAAILAIFGALTFYIKQERYWLTQYYGLSISAIVIIGFYVHYHFHTDPKFDIFLSNILTVMVYIVATITGLRFRFAFIIVSLTIYAYFIYVPLFNYSPIAIRQISQLVVVYLFTILSSYVLERQKINLFINRFTLAEEKSKVESLGAVKNKLFSVISHDLRSPITSLKGVVSLINKGALTQEEFRSLSSHLEDKLNQTSYLMDNLLAWSKSQMEGIVIQKVRFSLKEILHTVADSFKQDLEKKDIKLFTTLEDDMFVNADKEMIQIVVRNLLSNAIKFTPEGGKINVEGLSIQDKVHLFIKDNGSGISKEKLAHIFELKQENIIGDIHFEGAGIGLLLVKEFTDLNEGEISCESTLGHGTQFNLKFPTV